MDDNLLRFADDKKFVFIDCETLNLCLHGFRNEPWQIAMIERVGNKIVKKHDLYLDWDSGLKISDGAARVTRFSQYAFDQKKKPACDEMKIVLEALQGADYIAGHNLLGFDVYLLRIAFQRCGLPWKFMMPKIVDTLAFMKGVRMESKISKDEDLLSYQFKQINTVKRLKCSLGALGKEFEIDHDYAGLHNALNDLELNIKVWDKIKYRIQT